MRILTVHNRYLHWGGEDENHQAQVRLLREHGHIVDVLLENNTRVADLGPLRSAASTVWSADAYRNIQQTLRQCRYDVIEFHNTFPLISPSAYYAAHAERVPVVQVVHNYRLVCPSANLFRAGQLCEKCVANAVPWRSIVHACYRGSRSASAAVATMLSAHRVLGTWRRRVHLYVTPTEFTRRKLIDGGLPADRLAVRPHAVHPDPGRGAHRGGYALFVGRLAAEKGVATLLSAWTNYDLRLPLKIVGDGPLAPMVRAQVARHPRLEWLGLKKRAEVDQLIGDASVLVMPSEWYETFGLVVVEAYARGTPVIAARIGAVAEVVDHGETGLLFQPGCAEELAASARWAEEHASELATMGQCARAVYEDKYTGERNYTRTLELYERAIAEAGRSQRAIA